MPETTEKGREEAKVITAGKGIVVESISPDFTDAPAVIQLKGDVSKSVKVSQQEQRITMSSTEPDFEIDEAAILKQLKTDIPKGESAVVKFSLIVMKADGTERVIPVDEDNVIEKLNEVKPEITPGDKITIKKTVIRSASVDGSDIQMDQSELIQQLQSQFPEGGKVTLSKEIVKAVEVRTKEGSA